MKLQYYKRIMEKHRELNKRDCLAEISNSFPDVPRVTLQSIIFQECQRNTMKTYYHHTSPHQAAAYYQQYLKLVEINATRSGFLLQMADEVHMCPALMAKLILECHYKTKYLPKENDERENVTRTKISAMLKDTSTITDPDLAAEVFLCILNDDVYGPMSDIIRTTVGIEYEITLNKKLTELGISFSVEKQLREKGYDKTPDVKLDIPIVIEGQIINWVESKASFGDEERHKKYLRDQYWSYCNRFGPGLVIYWFGFIEDLNCNKEQGILIRDSLPDQVTFMEPDILLKDINDLKFTQVLKFD